MPRKRNSPLSRQIRAVVFKEERIQRSESTKYRKQIAERADKLPADRRAALIETAEKILKEIQVKRHPARTPPSLPADKATLIQSAREIARVILTDQGRPIPPDLQEEEEDGTIQLFTEEDLQL